MEAGCEETLVCKVSSGNSEEISLQDGVPTGAQG